MSAIAETDSPGRCRFLLEMAERDLERAKAFYVKKRQEFNAAEAALTSAHNALDAARAAIAKAEGTS